MNIFAVLENRWLGRFAILFLLFAKFSFLTAEVQTKNIALVVRSGFLGEVEFAHRIIKASENIGWKASILDCKDPNFNEKIYDFAICLVPGIRRLECPSYLALFDPKNHYFRSNGMLKIEYAHYNGYLITYEINLENKSCHLFRHRPWMSWMPSVQFQDFQDIDPSHLFYICCNWGNRCKDQKYKTFLHLLDETSDAHFYGLSTYRAMYPNSYVGVIPMDGESVLKKIHSDGICLVLHSSDHLENEIPSGRIFEAVASSSVVISDKNPFVMKNFGDSILYIDHTETGESLFQQTQEHINWIKAHKEEANTMAKKAHDIYKDRFLLEDQLIRLGEFHDQVTSSKFMRMKNIEVE